MSFNSKLLIVNIFILSCSNLGNERRAVWRMCILMLGCKGSLTQVLGEVTQINGLLGWAATLVLAFSQQ